MISRRSGAIVFVSSCSHLLPSQYISIYGSSKAFISQFSHSLSSEAAAFGIDVLCIHPQYTRTNLYENVKPLNILKLMNLVGSEPEHCVDAILRCLGRINSIDIGLYSYLSRVLGKVLDPNLAIPIVQLGFRILGDLTRLHTKWQWYLTYDMFSSPTHHKNH